MRKSIILVVITLVIISLCLLSLKKLSIQKDKREAVDQILDLYSQSLSNEEFKQVYENAVGDYAGIGVVIEKLEDGYPRVVKVLEDSPAERRGIRVGNTIVQIEGRDCAQLSLFNLVNQLRGNPNSVVNLRIKDESGSEKNTFLMREKLNIETVREGQRIEENVVYLQLVDFNSNSKDQIVEVMNQLTLKESDWLVIDLRGNSGGSLDAVLDVCDLFLPKDLKLLELVEGEDRKEYFTKQIETLKPFSIIILVDRFTASAAEILSVTLREYEKAILIGTRTFGKGSVQTLFPKNGLGGNKLTTGYYLTSEGRFIDEEGIVPDIKMAPLTVAFELKKDPFVLKALEMIHAKKS